MLLEYSVDLVLVTLLSLLLLMSLNLLQCVLLEDLLIVDEVDRRFEAWASALEKEIVHVYGRLSIEYGCENLGFVRLLHLNDFDLGEGEGGACEVLSNTGGGWNCVLVHWLAFLGARV